MSLYLRHNFNENKYHCMFQGSKVAVPLCPLALIMKFEDLTFGMDIETGVNNWRNYLENKYGLVQPDGLCNEPNTKSSF